MLRYEPGGEKKEMNSRGGGQPYIVLSQGQTTPRVSFVAVETV